MAEEADYTNWRVMVDDTGKVLRDEEEGGYCVWNIKNQSVLVLPPDDESTNLIAHLLLRPEEDSTQSVLKIAVQTGSDDDACSSPKEGKEMYWLTKTPNVEGSSNCTELLIMVVGTYVIQKMLNDSTTDNKKVWQSVAKKINDCGYRVPGRTLAEQGEEVHKKWKHLETDYLKFKGSESKEEEDRPQCFEALDKILGNKQDSDSLVYTEDTDPEDVDRTDRAMSPTFVCQIIQDLSDYERSLSPQPKPSKDDIINYWSTETPNVEGCKTCAELMITLVGDDLIQELIKNKTISQKKVWQYIAKIMDDNGHKVPGQTIEEKGEKVYQKWKNMGRMYVKFKEIESIAQPAYRDPPSYFKALDKIVQKLQQTNNTKLLLSSFPDSIDTETHDVEGDASSGSGVPKPTKEDIINYWATETPDVEGCRNCAELLIMIIGENLIQEMFNDKKSSQKKVWQYIAKIMGDHGYRVPGETLEDQGEKVYQKWKNMGRMYTKYKDHVHQTEPAYKDPPICFDALDKVVKQLQQSDNQKLLLSSFCSSKKPGSPVDDDTQNIKEEPAVHYKPTKDDIINFWLTETPDIEDCNNCTELLIKTASSESIQKLLTNKKTSKKKVWQIVAQRLSDLGYKAPGIALEDQGEKVYQKWKNMGNSYTKYKAQLLKTGKGRKDPPLYFDLLDKVLGKNESVQSILLLDSFSESSLSRNSRDSPVASSETTKVKQLTPPIQSLPKTPMVQLVNSSNTPKQQYVKEEPSSFWNTETPNIKGCKNCAELLILIVGGDSVQKMLRDRMIPRKKVWQIVAEMMHDYGYKVPGLSIGLQGERVHQKWRNMEKVCLKNIEHMRQTGEVHKDPPPYFDLMKKVLSMKYEWGINIAGELGNENTYGGNEPKSFWLTETPNLRGCRNVTELLILLFGNKSVQNMLLHGKTGTQKKVWEMIAKKMSMYGYRVPGRTLAGQGEKLRDKWKSVKKVYRKYKNRVTHSARGRKFFPSYFDVMDLVFRRNYTPSCKSVLQIQDSREQESNSDAHDSEYSQHSSAPLESSVGNNNESYWRIETPDVEGIGNVTELLINIVGNEVIRKMLYNKKTVKKKVWQTVVNRLNDYGYPVPGSTLTERGDKVRHKWRNMEKIYLKYKDFESHTGQTRKFFPYYYDAMHKVSLQ